MKIGAEDKKKLAILGVVGTMGIAAAVYLYSSLASPDIPAPAPAAPPPVARTVAPPARTGKSQGGEAARLGTTSAQLDPTLKMGPMLVTESLVYSGTGRNIFSSSPPPPEIPQAQFPVRPNAVPVAPPPPPGPPPPPPIDLTFFGTETSANGQKRAFLLKGEDVFLASEGDIVERRYKIRSITANSVVVEDMAHNNQQTLPLIMR
jgi:hypothetical protein